MSINFETVLSIYLLETKTKLYMMWYDMTYDVWHVMIYIIYCVILYANNHTTVQCWNEDIQAVELKTWHHTPRDLIVQKHGSAKLKISHTPTALKLLNANLSSALSLYTHIYIYIYLFVYLFIYLYICVCVCVTVIIEPEEGGGVSFTNAVTYVTLVTN